jgi:ACS family 4-hydroxyphenylacetate permease-like MFS transporter
MASVETKGRDAMQTTPPGLTSAIGKVSWRLIPFLFILYVFNYLDRINVGFAALSMNRDLALTATTFGLANTIFYIGYVACELPSNLLMARYGARKWLSRIMITWGLASAATMFVVDAKSLFVVRFFVGVLEAGFVPGVLLYMTYWFPDKYRARANGFLMMAQPLAMAVGAVVSGIILDSTHGFLGLQGWRWLFLIEGLPAALLGIIAYWYLTNRPAEANWLTAAEKSSLESTLRPSGQVETSRVKQSSIWTQVFDLKIVLLALTYFSLVNTLNATATWGPTIVRDVMKAYSLTQVGFVAAIAPVCTFLIMPLWVWSSDRKRERIWHLTVALGLAAIGWLLVIGSDQPLGRMLGLCFATMGAFSAMAVFWTLPQGLLSDGARPGGIGLISAVGLLGSAVSPAVIGVLRDLTGNFSAGLFYVAGLLCVAIALAWVVVGLSRRQQRAFDAMPIGETTG